MNRLVIGTAQFGMNYGITNTNGKLKKQEVSDILQVAKAEGLSLRFR